MSVKLRNKTLASGAKSYYLDIYSNGERQYEFLKIYINKKDTSEDKKEKKQLAESIRAKRELQLSSNEHGFIPKHKKNVDFILFYEKYLKEYKGKDERLLKCALDKFKLLVNSEKFPAKHVTPDLCQKFADFLKDPENGLKGETPSNYWTKFKRVLKAAKKEGILSANPAEDIRVKKASGQLKKEILTKEELQILATTPCGNEVVKRAFLFACFTGLGIAEIRKLTWSRVNNGKLKVYREKTNEQIINDLHPVAKKLLGEIAKPETLIFSSLPSDVAIRKVLINWVKRAGLEKHISFYCGRHTFATQLLLNGANLKTVADCMGQTSTRHTLKYLNYVDSLKSEAINNLPDLDF
ncbi:MAG: site-specific integrase [Saprospiraceae bacterium]